MKTERRPRKIRRIAMYGFSYILVFIIGMYAYKNPKIRSQLSNGFGLFQNEGDNESTGEILINQPPTIHLDIPDSAFQVISFGRDRAIEDGILRDSNKVTVRATMRSNADDYKVDMRLKGDYPDHWSGDKWSYRIKVRKGKRYAGMKTFSIQDPATRRFLNEWFFHELLKYEGLIALNYQFVRLIENGVDKGIYAVEQSFDKRLIEGNNRREAPILKFDESILIDETLINSANTYTEDNLFIMAKLDMFKSNKTLKDSVLYDQYQKAKWLINNLREGKIELEEAVDVDKAALLFALADLTNGHHALRWKNVRMYYNPVIGKIELIGFDSNSGYEISDIFYNHWKLRTSPSPWISYQWKDLFFENEAFVEKYFECLKRISSEEYLDEFFASIQEEQELYLSYIHSEKPDYIFKTEDYTNNAATIREKVRKYEEIKVAPISEYFVEVIAIKPILEGDKELKLSIVNNSVEPITVDGIFDPLEKCVSKNNPFTIPGRQMDGPAVAKEFTFQLSTVIDTSITNRKINQNRWVHQKIKLAYRFPGQVEDTNYTKIEEYYSIGLNERTELNDAAFEINHEEQKIVVKPGEWDFSKDVVTPKGYSVHCSAGTSLYLNKGTTLTINGPVYFKGSPHNRVLVSSRDSSGTFLVYQTTERSEFENTDFIGLSENYYGEWQLSGGVNFYEANVDMDHVTFSFNKSEDALNIVRSNFTLADAKFTDIYADAFDGDFCQGIVARATFVRIGNDALDFSGSKIRLEDIAVKNVGDKGISAGEKSYIYAVNIEIESVELALVSKDYSFLKADKVDVKSTSVGCTVFKKKKDYGPARMEVDHYTSSNLLEPYLVEYQSSVTINGERIKFNHFDVINILYGAQYGKSSH